ncbi:MAG: hypothetical protein ACO32I_07845, partial [Candidatus Limnocylindrus sp.]
MWIEILIAFLGKLAILVSIVSEARAASDMVGLLGVMGAVGAVVGVASTATSAINEVVGRAVAGTAPGGRRPRGGRLLVMGARGHRDLPIPPDFCGRVVPTSRQESIQV